MLEKIENKHQKPQYTQPASVLCGTTDNSRHTGEGGCRPPLWRGLPAPRASAPQWHSEGGWARLGWQLV